MLPADDPTRRWAGVILEEYDESQRSGLNPRTDGQAPRQSTLGWETAIRFLQSRRSIRSFIDQPLTEATLRRIVEALNWCSTSCNRQPGVVFATFDGAKVRAAMRCFAGASGFSSHVPCFLVFTADLRAYTMPLEVWLPAIDCSLGMQSVALAAHAAGLSMTILSWAHHSMEDEEQLRDLFRIPQCNQIIAGAALGYPATALPPPGRKSIDQTLQLR
jgi:nitroreductase